MMKLLYCTPKTVFICRRWQYIKLKRGNHFKSIFFHEIYGKEKVGDADLPYPRGSQASIGLGKDELGLIEVKSNTFKKRTVIIVRVTESWFEYI